MMMIMMMMMIIIIMMIMMIIIMMMIMMTMMVMIMMLGIYLQATLPLLPLRSDLFGCRYISQAIPECACSSGGSWSAHW